jgi:hypothetical protein
MDPETTLQIMRETVAQFRAIADRTGPERKSDVYDLVDLGDTMAEAFAALDGWLSGSGFKPKDWT